MYYSGINSQICLQQAQLSNNKQNSKINNNMEIIIYLKFLPAQHIMYS